MALSSTARRVVIVAGDFVKTGGMDRANYALADYLGRTRTDVTLVGHRVAPEIESRAGLTVLRVPKPLASYALGEPLLDFMGRWQARKARGSGGVTVVNGGNCIAGQVNWVHYVHAAYPQSLSLRPRGFRKWLHGSHARKAERAALRKAELVLTNSAATRKAVVDLGVAPERAFVVYYGMDASEFAPVSDEQSREARRELGWPSRPCVAFVGALGDRRKGFDTLFAAWEMLCRSSSWDVDLVAVGAGAELAVWRERVEGGRLGDRIRLLGFRNDVARVIAACDAMAAPARYEAFGLGVAEALARGLPAIVSASSGVAELYPAELHDLLLDDHESPSEVARVLVHWRESMDRQRERVRAVSDRIRARSWDDMSAEVAGLMDEHVGRT